MVLFKSFIIFIFLVYITFWFECKHPFIAIPLNKIRFIFWYFGFWHAWNMFSRPYHFNRSITLNITYDDDSSKMETLYSPEIGLFLNGIADSHEVKLIDNILADSNNTNIRRYISKYLVKHYSSDSKKVKQLEFIVDHEPIIRPGEKNPEQIKIESVFTYKV